MQLPKALCAKRQQLLPLKVGQMLALNYVKVPLLRANLLTTMMYNTECLIQPRQTSHKPLPSNSALKTEVVSLDPLSQSCSRTKANSCRKQIYPLVRCSGVHCAICVKRCWDKSFYWKPSKGLLSGGDESGGEGCLMQGNPTATNVV